MEPLQSCPAGKTMIVGVGNPLRGDDGIGPLLIQRLKGKTEFALLDCGEVPENFAQRIIDFSPDTVILVDAADWKGSRGQIKRIPEGEIANASLSTHNASLRLFIDYLRRQTRAKIIVIGVQAGDRGLMDSMSPEVEEAAEKLERWIVGSSSLQGEEDPTR